MRIKKIATLALSALLFCTALTGCANKTAPEPSAPSGSDAKSGRKPNEAAAQALSVTAAELQAPVYGEQNSAAQTTARGANEFAFKLSAALSAQSEGNFVCSPYSVWLPLAALVNATDAEHKAALLEALGAAGVSESDINTAASRMLYDLTRQRSKEDAKEYGEEYAQDPLKIANAIFVDNDMTLKKDFAQTFMDAYRGAAFNVDFGSNEAVDAVNQWASDNTNGLIQEIVQQFDPATVAAIANAIYFSDRWDWEFDPGQTKEDVFHAPSGDTQAHYMLREGDDQTYYEDDKLQAIPLRFKTGGGMYILLPRDGDAKGLLASFTNNYFEQIQNDAVQATGKLLLPRFSIASNVMPLNDALIALDVPLFDAQAAPLTGGVIEEDIPVWLSGAVQKAVIEVDERGTTAAAVTVMALEGASMPEPTEPFTMDCNAPFVFVLYGDTYDGGSQVLFTGAVEQPE